jgi:hypothetical protein
MPDFRDHNQPKKTVIQARDIIIDIKSGMSDERLMAKYKLSGKGLRSAFTKLTNMKLISAGDLYSKSFDEPDDEMVSLGQDSVVVEDERQLARLRPKTPIIIFGNHPSIKGEITDINMDGVGIRGIKSSVGEIRTFLIMPDRYLPIDPLEFKAECMWAQTKRNETFAGYRITEISHDGVAGLKTLINILELQREDEGPGGI